MPALLLTPAPHTKAAQFLRDKPAVARAVFDQLLPELQARAFTITGVESANVVQAVRDRIAELPLGADWAKVKADIADKISPWLDQSEGGAERAERRAELLMRNHGYQAYAASQEQVMARQRAAFPYAQYQSAGDAKVRPTHAALDGVVMPSDSPFWDQHTPPWEYGCRCRKVFLTADDVGDMEQADAQKPPEARRVLSPEQRTRLETSGQLQRADGRGVPQSINVTPRAGAPTWNPRTLTMDADALRARYDAETWRVFEAWARHTQLDGLPAIGSATAGRTVLDWLNQRPTAPASAPAVGGTPPSRAELRTPKPAEKTPTEVKPAPEPEPPKPALPSRRNAPVSNALTVRTTSPQKHDIHTAMAAVDQVHGDGDLQPIPIYGRTSRNNYGYYSYRGTQPNHINIGNHKTAWPAMTTIHEIGHMLDHQVLGRTGDFASEAHPLLAGFRQAVMQTGSVRQIQKLGRRQQGDFLTQSELWARAYAQYIATRSNHPLLRAQLARIRTGLQPWRQWDDDDFKPVADAIDTLFREKGWI